MTIDQIVSISSSIATWITAIIILLTLFEMAKQRKNTIKPDIVPINQLIYAQEDMLRNSRCPSFWTRQHNIAKQDENYNSFLNSYIVTIHNLGNGSAKDLLLQWEFDIVKYLDIINSLSQTLFTGRYVELSENNLLIQESKDGGASTINLELDLQQRIDYVLPASVDRTGAEIKIPYSYIYLVSHYAQLVSQSPKGSIIDFDLLNTNPLHLSVTYHDIAGNSISNEFVFKVQVQLWARSKGSDVTFFHAMFNVEDNKSLKRGAA